MRSTVELAYYQCDVRNSINPSDSRLLLYTQNQGSP